jgi:hypothetical protein
MRLGEMKMTKRFSVCILTAYWRSKLSIGYSLLHKKLKTFRAIFAGSLAMIKGRLSDQGAGLRDLDDDTIGRLDTFIRRERGVN